MLFEQKLSDEKYRHHDEWQRTSKSYTLRLVPRNGHLKILDAGCGTVINSVYMQNLGHRMTGCDISSVALKKFRQRLPGREAVKCNLNQSLPFSEKKYDLVFASEVIEHLHDPLFFATECYRILKPGGMLLLSTPNSAFWIYRLFALFGKTLSELQHPGHIRFFSKASLMGILRKAGFSEARMAGRHMYLIGNDTLGKVLSKWLPNTALVREYRFRKGTFFWHVSRFTESASAFWADTLIVQGMK